MEGKRMNKLLDIVLKQVHSVGMSTANAISRTNTYEPEEDMLLSEMICSRQSDTDTE